MSERTKLVVRHLPPNLPEPVFWKSLSPWLDPIPQPDGTSLAPKCTATFKSFVAGKVRKNKTKVDIPSRAYIQFATPEQVVDFHQGYANQVFRDGQGNLTFPKVEFAPYQKVSGPPKKIDNRIGTIEADPDYQAFLEKLAAPAAEANASPNQQENETEKPERPEITPLIEHLRSLRKAAQDAASNPKQQRHSTATHSSTNKSASGRAFAGPPQIMKRVAPSSNAASNPPAGIPPKKSAGDSITHEQPPHMASQAPSSSKGAAKQSSGTIHPSSTSQPPTNTSNKSRANKPAKSKRTGRGAEGQQATSDAPHPKGANKQVPQQPKAILQPPSKSTDPTQSGHQASNKDKQFAPSTLKKGETSKKDSPDPHGTRPEAGSSPKKSARGGGGVGRGGKGGGGSKPINSVAASSSGRAGPSSSAHGEDPSRQTDQHPSGSKSIATTRKSGSDASHPSSSKGLDPNNCEAAGARRRLVMALAGIASSKSPSSSGRASSRKDNNNKDQPSKTPAPPAPSSSSKS